MKALHSNNITKIVFHVVALCLCAIVFVGFCSCKSPDTTTADKPYLKSSSNATYNNAPITFEFVLNGYELSVIADNFTAGDYKIEGGNLTINTTYFERENKKEYTIAYSLKKTVQSDIVDEVTGNLKISSVVWSDITWH